MKRTAAIVILAILAAAAGVLAFIDIFRYLSWLFSPLSFLGAPALGAMLSLVIAAIWIWAAIRVWYVDPRGWLFMVSIAVIYLILDLISLIAGTPIELLIGSIAISTLVLILGLLPSTKREFGTKQG